MDPPVDFYAGAIAMFAVVVVAKFLTHHARHIKNAACSGWCTVHWICVGAAWLGLFASFLILAEVPVGSGWELVGRSFVGLMALVSGTLLAIDVAAEGHL